MKTRMPAYYPNFHCIAGDCPDTCCAGWEIDLDEAAYQRYQSIPGELGSTIRAALSGDEGSRSICRTADGRCAFLQTDGLCRLVLALGEAGLGEVCHLHPRFISSFGSRQELCLSLSCPEAARLIVSQQTPLTFLEASSDAPVQPNEIDYALFVELQECREIALSIAQNRDFTVCERTALLLAFGAKMQEKIDGWKLRQLSTWKSHYRDAVWMQKQLAKRRKPLPDRDALLAAMLLDLAGLEVTSPTLPQLLQVAALQPGSLPAPTPGLEVALEQVLVYFLFRYFLQSCFDEALLPKLKLAAVGVLTIRTLWLTDLRTAPAQDNERRAWLAHFFSREIEHDDDNLARLFACFASDERYTADALSRLLISL